MIRLFFVVFLSLPLYFAFAEADTEFDELIKSGRELMYAHDYENALSLFERAIQINPNNSTAHTNKGSILLQLGNFSEAIDSFDTSLKLDPNNPITLNNKGTTLMQLDEIDLALSLFDQALAIDPTYQSATENIKTALGTRTFLPIDGYVEIVVRDKTGTLVAFIKTDNLDMIDHFIAKNTIKSWPKIEKDSTDNKDDASFYFKADNLLITKQSAYGVFGVMIRDVPDAYMIRSHYNMIPTENGDTLQLKIIVKDR